MRGGIKLEAENKMRRTRQTRTGVLGRNAEEDEIGGVLRGSGG